jgi:nitrate reductase gamma subunit
MTFMNLPISNQFIDIGGIVLLAIVLIGLSMKISGGTLRRFPEWRILRQDASPRKKDSSSMLKGILNVIFVEAFTVKVLGTCDKVKRASHIAIFWGFVFTGVSTVLAYLTNPSDLVLPLTNPVKLFGNAGGIMIVGGLVAMFYIRYRERQSVWRIQRADYFLVVLLLTALTGFVTQQAIYTSSDSLTVAVSFWVHIVMIVLLFATAPFTEFGHSLFKPIWLLYDNLATRNGEESLVPGPAKINAIKRTEGE